jgi:hypothetical protein
VSNTTDGEHREATPSSHVEQIIFIRADQLLNITLTKTGLNLVQRLSVLFNDVYNKRSPMLDDDQPMLSLSNLTGQDIRINHFDGVEARRMFSGRRCRCRTRRRVLF